MSGVSLALELWLNPFSHTPGVRGVALRLCHSACTHNLRQPAAARHTFFKIRSRFHGKANACKCIPTNHLWKIAALPFLKKGKNFKRTCTPTHSHKTATLESPYTLRALPTAVWSDPSRSCRNFGRNQAVLCRLWPKIHMPAGASTGRPSSDQPGPLPRLTTVPKVLERGDEASVVARRLRGDEAPFDQGTLEWQRTGRERRRSAGAEEEEEDA